MLNKHIQQLIRQGEHQMLDFKYEINDSRKIARSLAAFSNTDGGILLIGVKDNGNITGIESEEEYYMVEAAAQLYCRPEVKFETSKWEVNGKTVLEIIIPRMKKRPCLARNEENRWIAYVRVGDQNLLASGVQRKVWQKESSRKGVRIRYSRAERSLLELLREENRISLSQFFRKAALTRQEAEETLADFVLLGILEIVYEGSQPLFRLKQLPDPEILELYRSIV